MSPVTNAGNISIIFLIRPFAFCRGSAFQLKTIMIHSSNWPRPTSPLIKSAEFANYLRNFNCLSPYLKCKSCLLRQRNNQGKCVAPRGLNYSNYVSLKISNGPTANLQKYFLVTTWGNPSEYSFLTNSLLAGHAEL